MDYELLNIVKERLNKEEEVDDDIAMSIICQAALDYYESRNQVLEYEEIVANIRRIFYKTRSKLNILKPLMDDENVTEIMVNGHEKIFYEKNNTIHRYDLSFESDEEVEDVMHIIAGETNREINEMCPIVDARLEDGSRVNGVYKNVAVNGPTLTIRKFSNNYITMEQLVNNKTINREGAELICSLVKYGFNIFISGGTSSGKTTLINALSEFIPRDQRVIVIEDSAELKLSSVENCVQLECRNSNVMGKGEVTLSMLIKNSLRMRPDRIIVGEVRGDEVFHMLQAMNTGHSGMCTGHGNSVRGMLKRLETMYLMAATIDINAIRNQIADALDVMIHIEKVGKERKVVEISEVLGYEYGEYIINPLMQYDRSKGFKFTGKGIMNTEKVLGKGDEFLRGLPKNGVTI